MFRILICSVALTAFLISGVVAAHPNGRPDEPGHAFIAVLKSLSLSDNQQRQVRALLKAHRQSKKATRQRLPRDRHEPPLSLTETALRARVAERSEHLFADALDRASLHHAIYSLLDETQQQQLLQAGNLVPEKPLAAGWGFVARLEALDLSESQWSELTPLTEQMNNLTQSRQAIMTPLIESQRKLVFSADFSESAWQALLEPHRAMLTENAISRALIMQQMLTVLTEKQRQQLHNNHKDKRHPRDQDVFRG